MPIGLGTALLLSAGGGLLSAALSADAASGAADTQASAAREASANALTASREAAARLQPFATGGVNAFNTLGLMTGTAPGTSPLTAPLTAPFNPADLTQTPGYKFTLDQGLQAVQSGMTSGGLGRSGPALKGAANYATGLASTTYNQQLQNYLTQNRQIFDMLSGQANLGENAAAGAGALGVQGTNFSNNFLTSGAAAQAAGQVGVANAIGGGINSLTSSALTGAILPQLLARNAQNPLQAATGKTT